MSVAFAAASSQYITYPEPSAALDDDFMVSCWIRLASIPSSGEYVVVGRYGSNNTLWRLSVDSSGNALFGYRHRVATHATTLSTNTWYHLYGGHVFFLPYIWVDGAGKVTGNGAGGVTSSNVLTIGSDSFASRGRYFDGDIEHVAIYSTPTGANKNDDGDVLALAAGAHPFRVEPDDLLFYTPLYDTGYINDMTGKEAIAGTANGSPTIATGAPVQPWYFDHWPAMAGGAAGPIAQSAAGSITPTGALQRLTATTPVGSITPTGALQRLTTITPVGSITPSGVLQRLTSKNVLSGSLTPTGALATARASFLSVAGVLTPSGALQKLAAKVLSGSIAPSGVLQKLTVKNVVGSIAPSGALSAARSFFQSVAGVITPTGALQRLISKVLTGSITPSGILQKLTAITFLGSITPAGILQKLTLKTLTGSITPSGILSAVSSFTKSIAGVITPSGILQKVTLRTLVGSITPSGILQKLTLKTLVGVITPVGVGVGEKLGGFLQSVSGAITPAGALQKLTDKTFAGSISPSGALQKLTDKVFSGSISPSGILSAVRAFFATLVGSIAPSGALQKLTTKILSGTITPTGALQKLISKALSGTLLLSGVLVAQKVGEAAITAIVDLTLRVRSIALNIKDRTVDLTGRKR